MKRIVLLLALLLIFCACGKEQDDGFELLMISDETQMSILDSSTFDVLPYSRDNADVELLINELNAVDPLSLKSVDFIDYKSDTPCVTLYLEEDSIYIFKVWSMGNGECATAQYVVGTDYVLYSLSFNNEKIAETVEKIYNDFRG